MKTLILSFFVIFLTTCKKRVNKESKTENPTENISWIKEYIEETKKSPFPTKAMIVQYTYNNEIVYLVDGCYQCPDAMSTVYNTKKEVLCTFGGMVAETNNTCPDFEEKATNKKTIWKSF